MQKDTRKITSSSEPDSNWTRWNPNNCLNGVPLEPAKGDFENNSTEWLPSIGPSFFTLTLTLKYKSSQTSVEIISKALDLC